jgi:hypothetical protein
MESSNDPIQVQIDVCDEMHRLAQSLRASDASSTENEIPEVYKTASDLITTVITCKTGFDLNHNVLQKSASFEALLQTKEHDFVQ